MTKEFGYQVKNAVTALAIEDQYIWDCAVIRAEGKCTRNGCLGITCERHFCQFAINIALYC